SPGAVATMAMDSSQKPGQSSRVVRRERLAALCRGGAAELAEVDAVDERVGDDRPQEVAAPEHHPAEEEAGDEGEGRAQAGGRGGGGGGRGGGGGDPAGRGRGGAGKEGPRGEAGGGGEPAPPRGGAGPRGAGEPLLELLRRRDEAAREAPDAPERETAGGA